MGSQQHADASLNAPVEAPWSSDQVSAWLEPRLTAKDESGRLNEASISVVRLAIVVFNTVLFLLVTRQQATLPALAYAVIVAASAYSVWMLVARPYERFRFLVSAWFVSVADGVLITLWLAATGGFASPFFPLWYVSIVAVSFRYGAWAALLGSSAYAVAYGGLVHAMGGLGGNVPVMAIRVGYIFLAGGLASLLALVTYQQTVAKQAYRDVAERLETARAEARGHAERLQRSNEDLRQVAYAISHDVREPLRVIGGYAGLLETKTGDRLEQDEVELVDQIRASTNRLDAMIESLLDYARLDRDGPPEETVHLEEALNEALDGLSVRIEESRARIHADELGRVRGDPRQVALLFQNLVENAIKYSGDTPPRVQVRSRTEEGRVRVEVEDEGIGIPPAEQDHVFEVFHRGSRADRDDEGEGMGLALCQRLVERHGGTMGLESTPDEGTTFWFTLPRA